MYVYTWNVKDHLYIVDTWQLISFPMTNSTYFTMYSRWAYFQSRPHRQSIRWQNFDHVAIEFRSCWDYISIRPDPINAMTHILVLGAKVRRNERLKWAIMAILDIGNMFGPTFGLKNSQYFLILATHYG